VKNKPERRKYAESSILNFLLEVIYLKKLLNQDFMKTERQFDRETERQRDRETERQRDRETERQRDRETERQRDRETERQRDRETERQRDRETETDYYSSAKAIKKVESFFGMVKWKHVEIDRN
jgi:hypothetical protein